MAEAKFRLSIDLDTEMFEKFEQRAIKFGMTKTRYIRELIAKDLFEKEVNPRTWYLKKTMRRGDDRTI